jgi:hypothetical protein
MTSGSTRTLWHPRWLLALLALLTLTGCLDILEEIWIQADGSARVTIDIAVPKSLLDLLKAKEKEPFADLRAKAQAAEAELKKDPDVVKFEFREFDDGGQYHLIYELTVKDATKLGEVQSRAMARAAESRKGADAKDFGFHIERTSGGQYVFTQRLGEPKAGTEDGESPEDAVKSKLAQQMAQAMFANNYFTVRVHGPAILETNGRLNEQKDMVEWKYNLAALMGGAEKTELRAVVQAAPPYWLWAVVLGIPLAVLSLAVAAARRKRAHSAR